MPSTSTRASASSPSRPSSPSSSSPSRCGWHHGRPRATDSCCGCLLGAPSACSRSPSSRARLPDVALQDAFGYTVLRVFVDGFEMWLGWSSYASSPASALGSSGVPRAVLVSGCRLRPRLRGHEPATSVTSRNIDRFEAGSSLDHGVPLDPQRRRDARPRRPAPPGDDDLVTAGTNRSPFRTDDLLAWNLVEPGERCPSRAGREPREPSGGPAPPSRVRRTGRRTSLGRYGRSHGARALTAGPQPTLGEREPEVYGRATLADVEALCRETADARALIVDFARPNHEGTLVDWVQEGRAGTAVIVVNAAGSRTRRLRCPGHLSPAGAPRQGAHQRHPRARETLPPPLLPRTPATTMSSAGTASRAYAEAVDWLAERRAGLDLLARRLASRY